MTRIITKGLIGQQDINFGTSTFSRATSTGGTQILNQLSGGAILSGSSVDANYLANGGDVLSPGFSVFQASTVGLYRVSAYSVIHVAATTSSVMPSIHIRWKDADTSVITDVPITAFDASNTVGNSSGGSIVIRVAAAYVVTYFTVGSASVGGTSMQYNVYIRGEGPF